ncbi:uncharacterized protein HMPREF1541_10267 [Cyphellophora europaea CBS 101466]|uniref:Transcription factor domain-containing protein n=1 Tax=Cyphellophora europaea (strain CBS 101466) TaxID=1220924 RepID=W2S7D5_CYPE1|nr:uncharacterized protein HMPREF1541_10267 [Cyphellophora europaea CBS 101466]ETN44597.1 hypothetical protein HMPREF1541_10267 [Cyphellophora europaea CBS 101466]
MERNCQIDSASASPIFMLQHQDLMAALQSFSEKIHPWYPILESTFSRVVEACLKSSFEPSTDSFLVLMVLGSGAVAQAHTHSTALHDRPDLMYLTTALRMMHLIVLEQSLRSLQCLAAASIHYYLLLKPLQAHDLAVLAIKKAQDLYFTGAFKNDRRNLEHLVRVYRSVLLIEGELVVPLKLAESNASEYEEDIPLPSGIDIWSFEIEPATPDMSSTGSIGSPPSDQLATYLLAQIAMRRMLRRNTTAITLSARGTFEYAPMIARELEEQVHHWYSLLPESFRFLPTSNPPDEERSPQTTFLCTQYWAYLVSIAWSSVVKIIDSQDMAVELQDQCRAYFQYYHEFIKSATSALTTCLPNKWTLYASIFAISIGANMAASNPLLASLATPETWTTLRHACDAFGDESEYSPSLQAMRQDLEKTLSSLPNEHQ